MSKLKKLIVFTTIFTFMFQLIPLDKLSFGNSASLKQSVFAEVYSSPVPTESLTSMPPVTPNPSISLMDADFEIPRYSISGYIKPNFKFSTKVAPAINSELKIEIVGTDIYTIVDSKGYFEIKNIPENATGYNLRISKSGYLERRVRLDSLDSNIQIGTKEAPVLIWAGDISVSGVQDGAINMVDIVAISKCFNSISSDERYDLQCDFNLDKAININDINIAAAKFNKASDNYQTDYPVLLSPASTLDELKEMLTLELGKRTDSFTVSYTGDISSLDANLNRILTEVKSQAWIEGTVESSSFDTSGSAGNMSITFSMQYDVPAVTNMDEIKSRISAGMMRFEQSVEFATGMDSEQVSSQLQGIIKEIISKNDYLKFKISSYTCSMKGTTDSYVVTCSFEYRTTKQKENYLTAGIKDVLSEILKPNMDIHQKEKAIHDYITSNIVYDDGLTNYSAFDAYINKKTTCQGYAELTYKMLEQAGFEVRIVTSSNHAWNLVKLEDLWYHLDCTWDSKSGEKSFNYYNLSDTEIQENHTWNQSNYPAANTNYIEFLLNKSSDKYVELIRDISGKTSSGITFTLDETRMYPGKTNELFYKVVYTGASDNMGIQWSSSNTNVATVQNGVVTSVSVGTAVITAILAGKYKSQCTVVVVPETELIENVQGISFKEDQVNMYIRETRDLAFFSIPDRDYPGNILWFSSDPYIASVKDGRITAFCEGTVTITAILDGSYVDTCQVNITRKIPIDSSKMSNQTLSQETLQSMYSQDNQAIPSLTIRADGDINQTTQITDVYGEFRDTAGVVGHPINIETNSNMEWADISFNIDSSALDLSNFDDLVVAWHDPITDSIIPIETTRDSAQKKLSARITHFSTYMVINKWVLDQMVKKISNVENLLKRKQADLVIILDNKWSENLSNAKQNIGYMVDSIDASVDLNINFMVINGDCTISNYGWYTNKARPKFYPDYSDTSRLDNMKTLRQFNEDLNSIVSKGYSASNYPTNVEKIGSDIFTKAFTDASNLTGFRSGVSKFIFSFSEFRGYEYFTAVKNSVMISENETYANIQLRGNRIFNKYGSTEGTAGIYSTFNETLSNYIIENTKIRTLMNSTYSGIIYKQWSRFRKNLGLATGDTIYGVENDRYLILLGICLIHTPSYLVDKAENMPGGLTLSIGNHIMRVQNGTYKIVVKSGDTLGSISKVVTGNTIYSQIIYKENNLTSTSLTAGQQLDITRIISDERIALAIADEMTRNSALEDYINRYAASDVVGDIELYTAKLQLKDLMDWGGKLYNGSRQMDQIDMTNKNGLYDGIWDSRFDKVVKEFLIASGTSPNLKEVYDSLKTLNDKKMFLIHWINLDWQSWDIISNKKGKIEDGMNVYLYPAPKEWYENMPEPPRTDPVKGVITVNNKEDCQSALNYYNKYISPIERTRNYASPPRNLQHSWFMRTYGASGDDKGGIIGGAIEGLFVDFPVEAVTGTISGIWEIIKDPQTSLEGIKLLLSCFYDNDSREMLLMMIEQGIEAYQQEFGAADSYEKGKMIGKAAGSIILCYIGIVKAVNTGVKVIKALKESGSLIKYIRMVLRATGNDVKLKAKEISQMFKAAAEAVKNAKFSRTILQGMRGFMDDMASILDDAGMSSIRFNQLRPVSADTLSAADRAAMKAIRDAIPMPTNETIMQKVIPQGDIAKYISGEYNQVKGYITRAQDVKQLGSYNDIYDSLRLNYSGSAFNPATDECVGVIRFKTPDAADVDIPYGQAMGGNVTDGPPFTGNGFTAATNGQAIPEFRSANFIDFYDRAELYTITKDGTETLAAVYNGSLGRFVDILE